MDFGSFERSVQYQRNILWI